MAETKKSILRVSSNKEDEKLAQIKNILFNAVDEMEIMVFNMERELIESVISVEDVVSKKRICKIIIALGRLLRDFPKKNKYEKREYGALNDTRVVDFLDKMDKAIFNVKSKFSVIKDFVNNTNSLTNALTLALVLRDAKKIMLQEELDEDEEKIRARRASLSEVELESERNLQQRAITAMQSTEIKESKEETSEKNSAPTKLRSVSDADINENIDDDNPTDEVDEKMSEALKVKKGTLRKPRSQSEFVTQSSSSGLFGKKSTPNYADAVENLLSVQDDSLDLILKDASGIKIFRAYLKKEFAEDNLRFWEEVGKFKKLKPTDKSLRKKADEIFELFVKDGAEAEINLPGAIRKNIVAEFASNDVKITVFDQAYKSIFHLMENDSFRRFNRSEEFKLYVKSKGYQKISKKEQKKSRQMSSMSLVLSTIDENPED